jgi:hypothetical protein
MTHPQTNPQILPNYHHGAKMPFLIYLSGPGGIFGLNGRYGQSDGANVTVSTGDANAFYPATGQLQTPSIDPWGNIGV